MESFEEKDLAFLESNSCGDVVCSTTETLGWTATARELTDSVRAVEVGK